jgi:hypothetical protein
MNRADIQAKELSDPTATSSKVEIPAPVPADEVALKKKSKQERKEAGASKWTQEASEANQAMAARAEKSPIYQDDTLSDMAKKGSFLVHLALGFKLIMARTVLLRITCCFPGGIAGSGISMEI